ncbi:MAG: nucleotidyltransferase domain-containing protein [Chitinophagia bacterium]|nr:nucleotidyltransferase domain-containing protein [Chitinophagia bacterium]
MDYGLYDDDIQSIKQIFAAHPEVAEVILFGSRAMGNYRPGSDIDLAIMSDSLTLNTLLALQIELENLGLLYKIDLLDYKKIKDADVRNNILLNGKVFYRKGM